ncbi:hypothetical protein ONZ43_g1911 [Nemania bipapillata]|uniref:Uncharacterized protein n=1 Tax=Nemania bipapillata TaxID=110536 RepID=A0ACC2J2N3_9PEZI|nr:hypothetical protein ONZ43_g1911 [Nemania bipapillata]
MNTSDKRKSIGHPVRSSASSRGVNVIAAPPRAQFIRPASTSMSPPAENDTPHEQANSSSKDGTGTQAAKEREKSLQDKIVELKRELAADKAEFTRTLDRLSQNESETASYWQTRYSNLNQQFLRVDAELRVLRTEVDVREAEKTELREEWELLQGELSERDSEIRSLRSQITGLKQWVSTNTKKSDQTSDEEFGETVATLRNGLQNWAVSHFRKSSFDLGRADQSIIDDLGKLVPMYEELAMNETKAAFLQSVVSSILVEMIFDVYFVGLPEEQATQLSHIENYLAHLSAYHAWLVRRVSNFGYRFD